MIDELIAMELYQPIQKDILIVVKDQLDCVKNCIESIYKHTKDFTLYIWDNGSKKITIDYLKSLDAVYHREEENFGFIIPNNRLATQGTSPYIILLNSDTVVRPGWDKGLIGWLQMYPEVAIAGYAGGKLDKNLHGCKFAYGYDADYICGWCMALSRLNLLKFGLFDEENLKFAYAEDADLSLRVCQMGYKIYALHMALVKHIGNCTIEELVAEGFDFSKSFNANHKYLKDKWYNYLYG